MDIFEYKGSLAIIGYMKFGLNTTLCNAWVLKEEEEKWEQEFSVKVFSDVHSPLGFGKNGRSLFLKGENNNIGVDYRYQLLEYDVMDRCLKKLPIFADNLSCMQILSTSYDDLHANIFSGVVRKAVLQAANQIFLQGSTEQGQGLKKKIRAALGLPWMTKEEEARITPWRKYIAPGCMSDKNTPKFDDGLEKKHLISRINTWMQNYYSESLGLSGIGFKVMGDLKTKKDFYGKLVTGGGGYNVSCVYQEEQYPVPPKNKGKKRKSDYGG